MSHKFSLKLFLLYRVCNCKLFPTNSFAEYFNICLLITQNWIRKMVIYLYVLLLFKQRENWYQISSILYYQNLNGVIYSLKIERLTGQAWRYSSNKNSNKMRRYALIKMMRKCPALRRIIPECELKCQILFGKCFWGLSPLIGNLYIPVYLVLRSIIFS